MPEELKHTNPAKCEDKTAKLSEEELDQVSGGCAPRHDKKLKDNYDCGFPLTGKHDLEASDTLFYD